MNHNIPYAARITKFRWSSKLNRPSKSTSHRCDCNGWEHTFNLCVKIKFLFLVF